MMSWTIDVVLQEMATDQIRIMELARNQNLDVPVGTMKDEIDAHKYSPYIDEDKENKVHETMDRENKDEEVIR
jgi:hypothetical protein